MEPRTQGALLHLGYLRSAFMVGATLAERFPSEEAFGTFMNDPSVQEALDLFYQTLEEARKPFLQETEVPVEKLATQSYQKVIDILLNLAERLELPAEDLLGVLLET